MCIKFLTIHVCIHKLEYKGYLDEMEPYKNTTEVEVSKCSRMILLVSSADLKNRIPRNNSTTLYRLFATNSDF